MHVHVLAIVLRTDVLFPGMIRIVSVGRPACVAALEHHVKTAEPIVFVPAIDPDLEDERADIAAVGVLGAVLRVSQLPDGTYRVLVEGRERVHVRSELQVIDGMAQVAAEQVELATSDPVGLAAKAAELDARYREYTGSNGVPFSEHWTLAADAADPARLADQVAAVLEHTWEQQIHALCATSLDEAVDDALTMMAIHLAKQKIHREVDDLVSKQMDASQREFQLREQLKVIREELGDSIANEAEADVFLERIETLGMPEEPLAEAKREAERLRRVHVDSAEYTISRTWLDTLCSIPWSNSSTDTESLPEAKALLDQHHYGLEKIKDRILEFLAVRQLNPDARSPILCLVGPPGVGKTSLGQSIATALGRSYARIALGGIKDETEIRGHRRTYVGALPGRVVRALIRAGTNNPVLVLDELDKVGADFRGDPASALLEVLDPEQNQAFMDRYLDVPVDLSKVLFLATANQLGPIPSALRDRLEIVELRGYTEEEKLEIAKLHLLPRLGSRHGLTERLTIPDAALQETIRGWTREAGLRDLERKLAMVHRKVARKIVEEGVDNVEVEPSHLRGFLGPVQEFLDMAEERSLPGVVVGLAWTAAGGDILFIEATTVKSKRALILTGSLGDVMKESATAALTWLRSNTVLLDVPVEAWDTEFHVHVPAGGIPKDGPSAGVSMITALASRVTGRPVKPRLAMTGEITLRGKVLAVGGVKEKVLAARRAGVDTIILPARNQSDLEDVPAVVREALTFHFVTDVPAVLELALTPK